MSPMFARRNGFRWLATTLVCALLLTACSGSASKDSDQAKPVESETPQVKQRDTIVVAIEEDVNTLDPAGGRGTHTGRTLGVPYESLVHTNTADGTIQPWLAKSWTISPDGTEYTFKLRENVKFQDGTPFNAEAVKFTFDRSLDSEHPYHFGPYAFPSFFLASLKEVEVVDDLTVKMTLLQADPTFLANLVWSTGGIVSPTAVAQHKEKFVFHGAGTGPFSIASWDKGSRLVMKANPSYWDGAPEIQNLIFKPVAEEAARLNQLKSGDVDVVAALNPQLLPEAEKDKNVKILTSPGIHTWYVMYNVAEKPFNDVKVRQALNYAIDRNAIVNKVLNGAGQASTSFSYPGTWSYTEEAEMYGYDPAQAKKLLAEAGYPNGLEINFLVPQSGSGMVAPREIATVIQAQLQAVGVKVNIDVLEWVTYLNEIGAKGSHLTNKTYHMQQMSWMSTAADPGLYINYYLKCDSTRESPNGFNNGYYCNKELESLLDQAMQTVDQGKRADLYKQATVLAAKDAPWLFGFHSKNVVAARHDVQGITPYPNMNTMPMGKVRIGGN